MAPRYYMMKGAFCNWLLKTTRRPLRSFLKATSARLILQRSLAKRDFNYKSKQAMFRVPRNACRDTRTRYALTSFCI